MSSEPTPVRLVIVDDQRPFAEALSMLIDRDERVEVVGTASHASEAIDVALACDADVVLMDMNLPDVDGMEATRRLHSLDPTKRVIVFSAHDASDAEQDALAAGAHAYLLKTHDADRVVDAILDVCGRGKS